MTIPVLDLVNFESDIAEGCEYVLTSPRSLQACAKLEIKPIQLLKVTLTDVLNENPSFSIREARERLMEENEARNDLLQKCQILRNSIISGRSVATKSVAKKPRKSESLPGLNKLNGLTGLKRIESDRILPNPPSPNRSISSPLVGINQFESKQTKLKGHLKSNSVPPSLYSSPLSRRPGSIRKLTQNDKLVNSLLRKYSDRKREIKEARQQWLKWEEEKICRQKKKVQRQKMIQEKTAKVRDEFNISIGEMVAAKEIFEDKIREEKLAKLDEKMKKAEINAKEQKAEREARIKENAQLEEAKMERQKQRLDLKEKQNLRKEKEIEINLNKKLSKAQKQRKIKQLREAEALQRRNSQSRRHFENNYLEVSAKKESENRKKEIELNQKLNQAKLNNQLLMEQRSESLRIQAERKKSQIFEVQNARDILIKQQQDRIQLEMIKNNKQEQAAIAGLEKLRQQRLEQAKEKHEYERQRAQINLEKSKIDQENEKLLLEQNINKKTKRTEQLRRDREKTILISKCRAKKEGTRRELIKKDLETFDERARKAEMFANMIVPNNNL
jgi:hypothetical protein